MKTKLLEQAINRVLNEASGNPKKTYGSFMRNLAMQTSTALGLKSSTSAGLNLTLTDF